ncbi:hypothetical protein Poli38472_007466 [Pythium oligandrum]|uniref:Uncharacterized protein n=1 Tax=Pythium oligandrum TaxID=41045 RepID=A0A8K1CQK0_PYTOL|nr:hypothetical protein Poli38472_007466 [Pythium oligandrum]|eukprot:TMW67794.1 hypothetical protein Poli38472_007466 [Pythium oligandrum]
MASGQRRTNKTRTTLNGFSDEEVTNATAAMVRSSSSSARSSFVFGWRDTEVATTTWLDDGSIVGDEFRESERETPVTVFLSSIPHDLIPDIRIVCYPSTLRNARRYIRQLIHFHAFEIRSTKWAAYFLLLIHRARQTRKVRSVEAVSLRWVLCAYVRHEVASRNRQKRTQEKDLHRKMTEYRVAMQCICGTSVIKYGRKGKPHATHLMIDNGDTLRWTSKMLTGTSTRAKKNKSIPLAAILDIRAGPTTDVLHKAVQKGTLRLQDAKFTLSLITAKRTFDIKARNAAEREFLHRSLRFLVSLARDHEKQIAQQVELSIMKRIETLTIWKHGRKGRPHKTRLYVNRFGEVSWQGRTGDTIQLEDIRKIELGHRTAVFQRSREHGLTSVNHATRCFSLVTRIRTLDIETEDEQQRDWFVVAFRYLMDKVHEKTAALKREKAEKQLKLLQELCHANGNPHQLLPAPHA